MKRSRWILNPAIAAAFLLGGCPSNPFGPQDELSPSEIDEVLTLFNADLGDEGVAVTRDEVAAAFRDDPELVAGVLADLAGGVFKLVARRVEQGIQTGAAPAAPASPTP